MIKLFGKLRYHWQPELSLSIIYWSLTITPIFIGLSLLYERTEVPAYAFFLFLIFFVLAALGVHRYFTIEADGILRITSLNLFSSKVIDIKDIEKVEVTKSTLTLLLRDQSRQIFYMRKWPKKYFLDDLVLQEAFTGEVELLDNLIALDYFDHYQADKKPKLKK